MGKGWWLGCRLRRRLDGKERLGGSSSVFEVFLPKRKRKEEQGEKVS